MKKVCAKVVPKVLTLEQGSLPLRAAATKPGSSSKILKQNNSVNALKNIIKGKKSAPK